MSEYPLVILSHRKRQFIESALESIKKLMSGVGEVVIVDDSGDTEHYRWLDSICTPSMSYYPSAFGKNIGYLESMRKVFSIGSALAYLSSSPYVMLWEEDFILRKPVDLNTMAKVMDYHPSLAQLNLQRQAVYPVELAYGYMKSHDIRGYQLYPMVTEGIHWVSRLKPFTTNPGLIRADVLKRKWPSKELAAGGIGGAEEAMSFLLARDYDFGWLGEWDRPQTVHIGTARQSGIGY